MQVFEWGRYRGDDEGRDEQFRKLRKERGRKGSIAKVGGDTMDERS